MKDGFIKVADVTANTESIKKLILSAEEKRINLLVLPELCITGYTCGDLFFNDTLISSAKDVLFDLAEFSKDKYPVIIVGFLLHTVQSFITVPPFCITAVF